MLKDPVTTLEKIAKKLTSRDYYLVRRVEAKVDHAFRTLLDPDQFLRSFVPPELTVVSYEHDETQVQIVLKDNLGHESRYLMDYRRVELNKLIQLSSPDIDGSSDHNHGATITVTFNQVTSQCEELDDEDGGTIVQLLIRHPTDEDWYSAEGCGLHDLWTGAFERYVKLVQAR